MVLKSSAVLALALVLSLPPVQAAPVHLVDEAPVSITAIGPQTWLVDFGRVAFGNVQLTPPPGADGKITVHFGEAFADGRINRQPPGSVRYATTEAALVGNAAVIAAPAPDKRNTTLPMAVLTPPEWGVVLPFRWVEIEGWPGELRPEHLHRRAAFASTWNDASAAFRSSDETLNRIWELCRYSIKATTFAGVYVDGDRERIPYEGDAYQNQLSQYYVDGDVQMARDTFDRLMEHPTWPTEWGSHMIFIAHADWMQTGDTAWLAARYEKLKTKLRLDRARGDGLIVTPADKIKEDLVDWPLGERDNFVFTSVNTVMNAFHLRALGLMAEMARALHRDADATDYTAREATARAAFNRVFFDSAHGLYRDGEGTDHVSQHANFFPLAFGLVPSEHRAKITAWLAGRGMACSVYAAQYLLEALFQNDAATPALELVTAPNDRSWKHMVESGTTITWEAWDQHYKPNQDWNHAWGAAPANLFPRFILGAQPLTPGWARAAIRPNPGALASAEGKIPTPRGPIKIRWTNTNSSQLSLTLPAGLSARVEVPAPPHSTRVLLNGQPIAARRDGAWWILEQDVTGAAEIESR